MAIDIENMLTRVITEVFGDDADATFDREPKSPHVYRARISDPHASGRQVGLSASYDWCDVTLLDLRSGVTLFDNDDDEPYKEAMLRSLAVVAYAYLNGEGTIGYGNRLFRKPRPFVTITVNDQEWKISRGWGQVHYPDDES